MVKSHENLSKQVKKGSRSRSRSPALRIHKYSHNKAVSRYFEKPVEYSFENLSKQFKKGVRYSPKRKSRSRSRALRIHKYSPNKAVSRYFEKPVEYSFENLSKQVKKGIRYSPPQRSKNETDTEMKRKYEFERYCATIDTVDSVLEKYGVAIIPELLDEKETQHMRDGMWDYLEHITKKFDIPMKRNNEETWKSYKHLYPMHGMLLQHWGVGHSQMVWDLRQNPKIIKVFEKIHKTNDLLVSFDGASFHFPPEITNFGWFHRAQHLHTDQSYLRNKKECIQGWVTANPIEEGDATLTFLEGSHKFHKDCATEFKLKDKADWVKLDEKQLEFYHNKGCKQKFISCPAGSLILWDSRTIHCGIQPIRGRSQPKIRCIGYVCYTPRRLATKKDIDKRIKAFEELRMTTHLPHKPKLFAKYPRTYGNPIPDILEVKEPKISKVGRKLIGY